MAFNITPSTADVAMGHIFRATGGGTVFSSDLGGQIAFDYFDDAAQVNDALYFSTHRTAAMADLRFHVGTALNAASITLVWEYYNHDDGWVEIEDLQDDTNDFTVLGENRVWFPLQWNPGYAPINGLTEYWFRVRIDAVSGIVEGGANSTSVMASRRGQYTIDGDAGTFEDIYQWFATNIPRISLKKYGSNVYDFRKISLFYNSVIETKNEVLLTGLNMRYRGHVNASNGFWKLRAGELDASGRGVNGSTFIIYGLNNSHVCQFNSNTRCYGSTFRRGPDQGSDTPGYANLFGQFADCWLELAVRPPDPLQPDGFARNCQITNGLMIMTTGPDPGQFDDIHIIQTGARMFYCYYSSFSLKRTSWVNTRADWKPFYFIYINLADLTNLFLRLLTRRMNFLPLRELIVCTLFIFTAGTEI